MAKGKGSEHCYDMLIVGSGPVGLVGAYYAALRDMNVRILESSQQLGRQLTRIYRMKWVFDVPGIPPGVYAAGDIATYPEKLKLIGPGTAESMAAVNHAKQYIREQFPHLRVCVVYPPASLHVSSLVDAAECLNSYLSKRQRRTSNVSSMCCSP